MTAGEGVGGGGGRGGGAGGGHFLSNGDCCLDIDLIRFSARRAERRIPLDSDHYKRHPELFKKCTLFNFLSQCSPWE